LGPRRCIMKSMAEAASHRRAGPDTRLELDQTAPCS
jgi:hypothetical protein